MSWIGRSFALTLATLLATTVMGHTLIGAQEATPAAGSATPASAECPVPTAAELEALAMSWAEAVNARDLDQLAQLLHVDHAHHWVIGQGILDRDGFLASLGNLLGAHDNFSFTADDIIVVEEEGIVILRWTASGVQAREFGGFGPSDRQLTWTGILILEVECGQVIQVWAEADYYGRLQQLGVIPGPDATPEA